MGTKKKNFFGFIIRSVIFIVVLFGSQYSYFKFFPPTELKIDFRSVTGQTVNDIDNAFKNEIDEQVKMLNIFNINIPLYILKFDIYIKNQLFFSLEDTVTHKEQTINPILSVNKLKRTNIEQGKQEVVSQDIKFKYITNEIKSYNFDLIFKVDSSIITSPVINLNSGPGNLLIFYLYPKPSFFSRIFVSLISIVALFALYIILNNLYRFIAFGEPIWKKYESRNK